MKYEVLPHFATVCRSVPRLSLAKKETCQCWSVPTCLGLVYFIRLLAQLRRSTQCTQCCLAAKESQIREKKTMSARPECAPYPLCLSCCSGGRSPSWSQFKSLLLPGVVGTESRSSSARSKWMKLAERRAHYSRNARAHMYTRLLLFICTRVTLLPELQNDGGSLYSSKCPNNKGQNRFKVD